MRRRTTAAVGTVVVFLLVASGLFATGTQEAQPAPAAGANPYAGQSITVFMIDAANWRALEAWTPEFEAKSGIKVNFDILPEKAFLPKLTLSLSSRAGEYDVVSANNRSTPQLFAGGWVQPIGKFINDPKMTEASYNFADFIPGLVRTCSYQGEVYGIPMQGSSNIMMYNKEMYAAAGLASPPKNLDELMAYAKKLHMPEKEQYGIALRASREGGTNGFSWIMIWKILGGSWTEGAEQPYAVLDKAPAIRATEYWVSLLDNYGPPGISNYNWETVLVSLQQAKVSQTIDDAELGPRLENPSESKIAGKVGYHVIEGRGDKYTVGPVWGLFMAADTKNQGPAWEWLKWATSKETIIRLAKEGKIGGPTRSSGFQSEEYRNKYSKEYADAFLKAMDHGDPEYSPLIPQGPQIREILSIAISKALSKQATIEAAMKEANDQIKKLLNY